MSRGAQQNVLKGRNRNGYKHLNECVQHPPPTVKLRLKLPQDSILPPSPLWSEWNHQEYKCQCGYGPRRALRTVKGNGKECSHFGNQAGGFLTNKKQNCDVTQTPYSGHKPERTLDQRCPCFHDHDCRAHLFTMARKWDHPRCPADGQ